MQQLGATATSFQQADWVSASGFGLGSSNQLQAQTLLPNGTSEDILDGGTPKTNVRSYKQQSSCSMYTYNSSAAANCCQLPGTVWPRLHMQVQECADSLLSRCLCRTCAASKTCRASPRLCTTTFCPLTPPEARKVDRAAAVLAEASDADMSSGHSSTTVEAAAAATRAWSEGLAGLPLRVMTWRPLPSSSSATCQAGQQGDGHQISQSAREPLEALVGSLNGRSCLCVSASSWTVHT